LKDELSEAKGLVDAAVQDGAVARRFFGPSPKFVEGGIERFDRTSPCPPPSSMGKALGGLTDDCSVQEVDIAVGASCPLSVQPSLEAGPIALFALEGDIEVRVEHEGGLSALIKLSPGHWASFPTGMGQRASLKGLQGDSMEEGEGRVKGILVGSVNDKTWTSLKRKEPE
jgi:hypothetical protein